MNRLFEILSDGYILSIITIETTGLNGKDDLPHSQISKDEKVDLKTEDLKVVLDGLFVELYNHTKQFTSAPKVFTQDWNNDFVLKSIEETKKNILAYPINKKVVIKTSNDLAKDHFKVIEFVDEHEQRKDVLLFQTWFH